MKNKEFRYFFSKKTKNLVNLAKSYSCFSTQLKVF